MTAVLSDDSLDLIFRSAHTFNGWLDRPVDGATVRAIIFPNGQSHKYWLARCNHIR
jgi:hypothetical protein